MTVSHCRVKRSECCRSAVLLLLPLQWGATGAGRKLVYVFGVWALLIAAAAYIAPSLARPEAEDPPEDA